MAILIKNSDNISNKKLGIHVIKDHIYQTFDMGDLENWISVDNFDTIVFDVSNYIGSSHYKKLEFEFIPEKKYQYVEIYINYFGKVEGNVQINPSIGGGYYDEGKGVWKVMEEDTFKYYSELFKKQEFCKVLHCL